MYMNIKRYKLILLLLTKISIIYTVNICNEYLENTDCLENRMYDFNLCVILSNKNKNNKNVKKCIKNTIYNIDNNETYENKHLICYNKTLDINNTEVNYIYDQNKKVSKCLMESNNICYYNKNINCRKINNKSDFKNIYKCYLF